MEVFQGGLLVRQRDLTLGVVSILFSSEVYDAKLLHGIDANILNAS